MLPPQSHDQNPSTSSSSSSSPLPPLQANKTAKPLPAAARRILHSLSTLTSPSRLPSLLSQIIHQSLHLHPHPLLPSTFITTSLLSLRSLSPAVRLFSLLPFPPPSLLPFNSLLRSLSPLSPSLPFSLLSQLLRHGIPPNRHTFPPLLSALSRHADRIDPLPHHSLPLHSLILKSGHLSDPYVSLSLLHLYSASRRTDLCQNLFDEMPARNRNVVAWTTLIGAHSGAGRHGDALAAFERMHYAGVRPNRVTMVCALAACAARGAAEMGVWIHEFVERSGWAVDVVLGTALVDMYGKCGRVEDGVRVFEGMRERNVCTWNAVIGGFALAKSGEKAVEWLRRMEEEEEEEGVRPDEVTLIEVLRACGYSGMVEMGRKVFDSVLNRRYGFGPGIKHYGCMVDLLGRAGLLEEAMELIENMPFEPSPAVWGAMLGGCRSHGDLRLSEVAARRLVEMEPENVAHYVVLSNVYVEMGRWRDAEEVRRAMKERGMRKDAGWSFTEVDDDGRYNSMELSG